MFNKLTKKREAEGNQEFQMMMTRKMGYFYGCLIIAI